MKHTTLSCVLGLLGLLMLALTAFPTSLALASRVDKANSLSDCIAKADIIIIGIVDAKNDDGTGGTIRVRVLSSPLKGNFESKELALSDSHFKSDFAGSPEGPVVVELKKGYVFFLSTSPDGSYRLFDSYDGVMPTCGPVVLEIQNQVRRGR